MNSNRAFVIIMFFVLAAPFLIIGFIPIFTHLETEIEPLKPVATRGIDLSVIFAITRTPIQKATFNVTVVRAVNGVFDLIGEQSFTETFQSPDYTGYYCISEGDEILVQIEQNIELWTYGENGINGFTDDWAELDYFSRVIHFFAKKDSPITEVTLSDIEEYGSAFTLDGKTRYNYKVQQTGKILGYVELKEIQLDKRTFVNCKLGGIELYPTANFWEKQLKSTLGG